MLHIAAGRDGPPTRRGADCGRGRDYGRDYGRGEVEERQPEEVDHRALGALEHRAVAPALDRQRVDRGAARRE